MKSDDHHQLEGRGGEILWDDKLTMQVFTTIFLAETLQANIDCVEETEGIDQNHPGAVEFKETLKAYISRLEGVDLSASQNLDQI